MPLENVEIKTLIEILAPGLIYAEMEPLARSVKHAFTDNVGALLQQQMTWVVR